MRPLRPPTPADPRRLLTGLDPDQRTAVTAPAGLVVVRAGAGSGKTRVLTHRIAWRCLADGTEVDRTLAITFTRQAAAELRARLREFELEGTPVVGTFHAVARRLMLQDLADRGRRQPVIASNRTSLMSEALGDDARRGGVADVLAAYDWSRGRTEDFAAGAVSFRNAGGRLRMDPARFTEVATAYEAVKRKRGAVDVDDFLVHVVERCERDARFAESVRFQHRHLLVDEAQDMNPLQWAFVRAVTGSNPDAFLVGDPNQAIYGFNGADRSLFEVLPGLDAPATVVTLPSNYRCTTEVVDFAVAALATDGQGADAASVAGNGPPVKLERCGDPGGERAVIVHQVRRLVSATGSPDAVAVLVRVNSLADEISRGLESVGIPVKTTRTGGAWTKAVQTATSLTSRDALATWSTDVLEGGEFTAADPEHEVASEVRRFLDENRTGGVDGRAFGSWFATSGTRTATPGVEVLTFHSAKGREWPAVIVVGAERGLLPHAAARGAAGRSEEARLAYVAFTRAARHLVVTWTDSRDGRATGPSPFLPWLTTRAGDEPAAVDPGADVRAIAAAARRRDSARAAVRQWRDTRARVARAVPSAILTDAQVARLADTRPTTLEQVAACVDAGFARRFGDEIISIIAASGD